MMFANKWLISIHPVDNPYLGGMELCFQDREIKHFDTVITTNRMFGSGQKYVLGADDAATKPIPEGWWACRNLLPTEKAKIKLGEQCFGKNRQYVWVGDGDFIMYDDLEDGKSVQCVGCCREGAVLEERKRKLDRETL